MPILFYANMLFRKICFHTNNYNWNYNWNYIYKWKQTVCSAMLLLCEKMKYSISISLCIHGSFFEMLKLKHTPRLFSWSYFLISLLVIFSSYFKTGVTLVYPKKNMPADVHWQTGNGWLQAQISVVSRL